MEQNIKHQIDDELYEKAKIFIVRYDDMNAALLQRHFNIGYPLACRLVEALERDGYLGPKDGTKPHKVLKESVVLTPDDEPIHEWFELSYSSYLVVQRTLLQSMPLAWQRRFVACLKELREASSELEPATEFWVRARDGKKFVHDPLADYERGRRRLELALPKTTGE